MGRKGIQVGTTLVVSGILILTSIGNVLASSPKYSTVPNVCSQKQFDTAVSDKRAEWGRTAEREEKMRHNSD